MRAEVDLVSSFSFSDDGAEEAEAADRLAGTPAAHERQPAAAGVDGVPLTARHRKGQNGCTIV